MHLCVHVCVERDACTCDMAGNVALPSKENLVHVHACMHFCLTKEKPHGHDLQKVLCATSSLQLVNIIIAYLQNLRTHEHRITLIPHTTYSIPHVYTNTTSDQKDYSSAITCLPCAWHIVITLLLACCWCTGLVQATVLAWVKIAFLN